MRTKYARYEDAWHLLRENKAKRRSEAPEDGEWGAPLFRVLCERVGGPQ
jgi:hypothetical protein